MTDPLGHSNFVCVEMFFPVKSIYFSAFSVIFGLAVTLFAPARTTGEYMGLPACKLGSYLTMIFEEVMVLAVGCQVCALDPVSTIF